jgi:CheY-like chemotaxis protein
MSLPYRVTLLGFSAFERSALASYFRLAANRSPAYEQVETMVEAHFLIVDTDHAEAVRAVRAAGRVHDGVFIGGQAPEGASAWMMRPIDPLHVLRELDAMVNSAKAHQRSLLGTSATPAESGGSMVVPPSGRTTIRQPKPAPARRASDSEGTGFVAVPEMPAPPAAKPARQGASALIVDDSEIALRFLETRLQRLTLRTERASTSGKAIELLSQKAYDFIFLDVELGPHSDMDGLSLCQHIKRQHHHVGGNHEPVVVMVSAFHSELDRARGALAGADAYVGKPLDEAVLTRLLVQNGVVLPGP